MDPRGVWVRADRRPGRRGGRLLALLVLGPLLAACSDSTGPPPAEPRGLWLLVRTGTCGLTTEGEAFCWGIDNEGELGQGTGQESLILTPSPVVGGLKFEEISLGVFVHTCALTPGGEAFCWGSNQTGQLGDGTRTNRLTPTPVVGGLTFERIDAGDGHTCGVTVEGGAFCWGAGGFGQLGDGTVPSMRFTPAPVSGDLGFAQIGAGSAFTCGLTTEGRAFCWGINHMGQLGNGTVTDRFTPNPLPTPVATGLTFRQISVGTGHACAVTPEGRAFCWGDNRLGQLGDGTKTNRSSPTPVSGDFTFEQISAGGLNTCALTPGGEAFCWGINSFGEVGDGTRTERLTPTAVSGGLTFRQISAAGGVTCGVTVDGEAFCWGRGGGVGDGTLTDRLVPTKVAPPEK